ncbi:MAG: N-acetylglucosamine-6-phosphate deacetylase [Thermotogaceae bacterium]|nr:N-acetylglucosamine-6-phosphate deacetylase [Thermotogaceae bacterium]
MMLKSTLAITPMEILQNAEVTFEDGVIRSVGEVDWNVSERYLIIPGFVDTHIHGCCGYDTNDGSIESLLEMSKELVKYGVTSFIPTAVTASKEELIKVAKAVAEAMKVQKEELNGARILGLHLEGPYINVEKKGAQNPEYIRKPDFDEFMEIWEAAEGNILEITVAPEVEGAREFISKVTEMGVVVQLGHTNATYEEAKSGIYSGALKATHLFNGMRSFHHREAGVVGACLESQQVFVEMICDLVHLSEPVIRLVYNLVGRERMILISDAISATGLEDGEYILGGLEVVVKDGVCRLKSGALAGSTLTLDKAVRNLVKIGIPFKDAIYMATQTPVKPLGMGFIGCIKPGCKADFVVLDKDLKVKEVYIEGKLIYKG